MLSNNSCKTIKRRMRKKHFRILIDLMLPSILYNFEKKKSFLNEHVPYTATSFFRKAIPTLPIKPKMIRIDEAIIALLPIAYD